MGSIIDDDGDGRWRCQIDINVAGISERARSSAGAAGPALNQGIQGQA
jgi:hypothetical protein